jgi:thiosulfate/3-mercaptopyruvate sulfurtransferase
MTSTTTEFASQGNASGPHDPPGALVEPAWLRDRLGQRALRIVDLRDADAWAAGRVPGAVHLELAALGSQDGGLDNTLLDAEDFEALMSGLGISTGDVVIAYDDQWGLAAARLVWALHAYGHDRAGVLNGGWDRWVEEGGPTTTEGDVPSRGQFTARAEPEVRADFDWIGVRLSDEGAVFVDTRTPGEFEQGHVPGARCWDWFNAVPAVGWDSTRPIDELLDAWAELGVHPDREVVVYCRSGMRAAHTYVALRHAGFARVRLYDGSWQEWSAKGGARG